MIINANFINRISPVGAINKISLLLFTVVFRE